MRFPVTSTSRSAVPPQHGPCPTEPSALTPRRTDLPQLPRSLTQAIEFFAASESAKAAFGSEVHAHLLTVGHGETNAFLNQAVTDGERRRYFERT